MRRFGVEAAEHAADLRQLFHQVRLVLQPPGGVDDQHVLAGRGRLLDAVEHDSGRVAAFLARDDRRADAVAPDLQLLDRGGAEGVAGGEQDAVILLLQPMAELADGRRLARAVDADHEDDVGARESPRLPAAWRRARGSSRSPRRGWCEGRARPAARTSGAAIASRIRCDASGPRSDAISASSISSSVEVSSAARLVRPVRLSATRSAVFANPPRRRSSQLMPRRAVRWSPSRPVMRADRSRRASTPAMATGAKLSVWPVPSPSTSTRWLRADQAVEPARCGARAAASRSRAARAFTSSRAQLRHARGGRVRSRREGEDVGRNDIAIVEQFQGVERHLFSFGGKSGDEVGADGRVGSRSLDPLDRAHRVGAAVPALHPLQDHVVAGLQRQMEVRHQPRLAGDQLEQRVVDLDAVERRQAQALQPRLGGEQPLAEIAEPALVIGDVDAGEDDLLGAAVDLARDGVADRFERQRHAGPRACQIEQKVQRWSQPVCTATKLLTLCRRPAGTDAMTSFAGRRLSELARHCRRPREPGHRLECRRRRARRRSR